MTASYITGTHIRNHHKCERLTYLNFHGDLSQKLPLTDFRRQLIEQSQQYEASIVSRLPHARPEYQAGDFLSGFHQTLRLMEAGENRIYKPVLLQEPYLGLPDFLERVPGCSGFGNFRYRVAEIKRGLSLKKEYTLPIVFYSYLLSSIQGVWPTTGRVILGDGTEKEFSIAPYRETLTAILQEIAAVQAGKEPLHNIGARCRHCGWRKVCLEEAKERKDLSLLFNLREPVRQVLLAQGITTFTDLAKADLQRLRIPKEYADVVHRLQLQAQVWEQQQVVLLRRPSLPQAPVELFLDMEEDAESRCNYLFGVLIRRGEEEEYRPFLARRPVKTELRRLWKDFLRFIAPLDRFVIYHFDQHERVQLEHFATEYGIDTPLYRRLVRSLVDLYPIIISSVVLPLHSYSIKVIADYLGFRWSDTAASGAQAMYWYTQWLATRDERLLEAILQYNREDCMATRVVKDWLATL
ncbi:MAG: TM0106 family RecB-like putative nuclease [Nitrospinota bacterium]|nr:MAG: TM0106 family RecB-like putative nuclease [Nitrospinota bacterium]